MKRPSATDVDLHLPMRPVACAVLAALSQEPKAGFEILEAVNATVSGEPLLGPGSLYRLLRELRQEALITRTDPAESVNDERQVHHEMTPLGVAVLEAELARLRRTINLARGARASAR